MAALAPSNVGAPMYISWRLNASTDQGAYRIKAKALHWLFDAEHILAARIEETKSRLRLLEGGGESSTEKEEEIEIEIEKEKEDGEVRAEVPYISGWKETE